MLRDQTHTKIFFRYFLPIFLATAAAVTLHSRLSMCAFRTLKKGYFVHLDAFLCLCWLDEERKVLVFEKELGILSIKPCDFITRCELLLIL